METDVMDCERVGDERLQADKLDLLYGEADAEVRARVEEHLRECAGCRAELSGFAGLRRDLAAWQLPSSRPAYTPRGIVVPRWLAAAAALLLGLSLPLAATAFFSVQQALAEQRARADALEAQQRQTRLALEQALAQPRAAAGGGPALRALIEQRVDERLRAAELRQAALMDTRLAEWSTRQDAQRRVDLARVAEGLSYLDGRHGQQLARQNELLSYVLDNAGQRR
jgi:hypothetical protein